MMGKRLSVWLLWGWAALLAGDITGTVKVVDRKGDGLDLSENPVIVYLDGYRREVPPELKNRNFQMDTQKKQFLPRAMVIPVGATITFTNFDPIIHNVFSVSGKNRFDGGTFKKGEVTRKTFEFPGLVRVYCNVHHQMNAVILICDNPFFTYADKDGRYTLKNVPKGRYKLTGLHRVAGTVTIPVEVEGQGTTTQADLEVELKTKKLKRHLNKLGQPYKRERTKRY